MLMTHPEIYAVNMFSPFKSVDRFILTTVGNGIVHPIHKEESWFEGDYEHPPTP